MITLPKRKGDKPLTGAQPPHLQLSDQSPRDIYNAMARWAFTEVPASIGIVREEPTRISLPSARALWLDETIDSKVQLMPPKGSREFAHLHADGSWHLVVKEEEVEHIVEQGWGERHPRYERGVLEVMVYAPRNEDELTVLKTLVQASIRHASQATKTR